MENRKILQTFFSPVIIIFMTPPSIGEFTAMLTEACDNEIGRATIWGVTPFKIGNYYYS